MSKKIEELKEKRNRLIALSQAAKALVEAGEFDRVNEAITEGIYKEENPEIEEFKTFGQWKQEGKIIKKGSKGYLVWGQPRKVEQTPEGSEEPQEYKFWPVCSLFSNLQVM